MDVRNAEAPRANPQPLRSRRSGARVSEGPGLAWPQSKTRRVRPCSSNSPIRRLVILSAAAQREDRCLVAPPTLKGGPAQRVAKKLISSGLVKEVKAKTDEPVWRRDDTVRIQHGVLGQNPG